MKGFIQVKSHTNVEHAKSGFQTQTIEKSMKELTGEKPYECKNCFKCFANSGTLTKHVRTHFR